MRGRVEKENERVMEEKGKVHLGCFGLGRRKEEEGGCQYEKKKEKGKGHGFGTKMEKEKGKEVLGRGKRKRKGWRILKLGVEG